MSKIKLLIVNDDADVVRVIKNTLTSAGLYVFSERSLDAARERLQEQHFDFVLLELVLPDGPGTALVPDLRKAHTPFQYFSEFTEEEAIRKFGTQVEGLVLDRGNNGVRMDLLTRIYDHMNPTEAFV